MSDMNDTNDENYENDEIENETQCTRCGWKVVPGSMLCRACIQDNIEKLVHQKLAEDAEDGDENS